MEALKFKNLLKELDNLTQNQENRLKKYIKDKQNSKILGNIITEIEECPYCQNKKIYKWGYSSKLQRYRCKECKKTFNALTKTPLAHLRYKEKWIQFSESMINGDSLRESAKICGVDKNTTFRWRHRFLQLPKEIKSKELSGIVEADETFFLESQKGNHKITDRKPRKRGGVASKRGLSKQQIPVLILKDRNYHMVDAVLEHDNSDEVSKVLKPRITKDSILCSDGNNIYKSFAKKEGITHKAINVSKKIYTIDKIFHIQNVNSYCSRLKSWMGRFNGVATKYLDDYLGWRRLIEGYSNLTASMFLGFAFGRNSGDSVFNK